MLQEIRTWLNNPKREYASGIRLFNICATDQLKKTYGMFLNSVDPLSVKAHSQHYNILCNKLTQIASSMRVDPKAYEDIIAKGIVEDKASIQQQVNKIASLSSSKTDLSVQIDNITQKSKDLQTLNKQFTEKSNSLEGLIGQKNELNTKLEKLTTASPDNENPKTKELLEKMDAKEAEIKEATNKLNELKNAPIDESLSAADKKKVQKASQKEVGELEALIETLSADKDKYSTELQEVKDKAEKDATDMAKAIAQLDDKIKVLEDEKEELKDKMSDLEDESDTNSSDIEQLQSQLSDITDNIGSLKSILEKNNLKVVTEDDLPEDISQKYQRIKSITPLMGKIHSELSDSKLTDEERKKLAEELCALDDERRSLWDSVDECLEDGNSVLPADKEEPYSDDPLIRGMQIAKRITRLNQNIKRSKDAEIRHAQNGKSNLALIAKRRTILYQQELKELTDEINDKE